MDTFAEDKRIIEENERQFQKEQKRREQALANKIQRSTEGPAHHVVQVSAVVVSLAMAGVLMQCVCSL